MNELVERLSKGDHPVAFGRGEDTAKDLKERIDRGFVLVKFTGTQGGTELGLSLDKNATDVSGADFEQTTGTVHLVGDLILNYERVRCIADIDLATLKGTGHLEHIETVSP